MLVIGAGKTGVATANRLASFGDDVTLYDSKSIEELSSQLEKLAGEVVVESGEIETVCKLDFDLVVTSPGVPWNNRVLNIMRDRDIEVISEIELAYKNIPASRWVAVTGTNGKTTTTSLAGSMFSADGIPSTVCGNIGNPVIGEDELFETNNRVIAELSSFQLEGVSSFAPKVAAILNITPDHLDRHKTMENYIDIKSKIFANQSKDDFVVLNMDDPCSAVLADKVKSNLFGFSLLKTLRDGAYLNDGVLCISKAGEKIEVIQSSKIKLIGRANLENSLAASAIAYVSGVSVDAIRNTLLTFRSIPNRMELVAEKEKLRIINDSKATNVDASLKGIESLNSPIAVIMGGRDKAGDFAPLAKSIIDKKGTAILIGEASDKIASSFADYENVKKALSMEEAVELALSSLKGEGTLILSPACASFDMFKNYEERGDTFRNAVKKNLKTTRGGNA